MNKPLKKIIAREGLTVFGIAVASLFFLYIRGLRDKAIHHDIFSDIPLSNSYMAGFILKWVFLYLLIRFIIWAIKILKRK